MTLVPLTQVGFNSNGAGFGRELAAGCGRLASGMLFRRSMTGDTATKQRRLPNPEICRTGYLGETLNFSDCLVESPDACKYAVRLDSRVLCRHPDRRSFEKAEAEPRLAQ